MTTTKAKEVNLDQEKLLRHFWYDTDTGDLYRLKDSVKGRPLGSGGSSAGYIYVLFEGNVYLAHRLVWLYVHGKWPEQGLDHIDLNPRNNRISNLREASQLQNMHNLYISVQNSSGVAGVTWDKATNKWKAQGSYNGKRVYLGRFVDIAEAGEAYTKFNTNVLKELACT